MAAVPRFEPFRGLRYDTSRVDLAAVTAPPYDVIDEEDRAALAARSPYNAVRIDLPVDENGEDRYAVARRLLAEWRTEGVLVTDDEPCFYAYRMTYADEDGRPRHTTGVIGALELSRPGEADVLPHEHTTPKAKSDRLAMLQSCRANLSAVWGLSPAAGLTALCEGGEALGSWTDEDGIDHALHRIADPDRVAAITALVAREPVVIADGHHRYETSLAYRDERRDDAGGAPGPYDAAMTYVVELADDELTVRAIHRLIGALPDGFDLPGALEPFFELRPTDVPDEHVGRRMVEAGALCLVLRGGRTWLLVPRPDAMAGARDLDSSRLDLALAALPPHELWFQHGWDNVLRAVEKGEAQAGVLLRPATVAQIAATAHGGERMPPKTTFFHPKPKTGLVFRLLD
jgi:uncharacterized protein (DUF1015 family)